MNRPMLTLLAGGLACLMGGVLLAQPGTIIVPPDRAVLIVRVPADATVTVGGQATNQKGSERTFTTAPLEPGFTYSYEIIARWKAKGGDHVTKRTVEFQAGRHKVVEMTEGGSNPIPEKKIEKKEPEKKIEKKIEKKEPEKKVEKKEPEKKIEKKVEKKEPEKKIEKKTAGVWTDPNDPSLPPDFKIQGEYAGEGKDKGTACQIIALGHGQFQAVVLAGGLPGAGWDGKNKSLMEGKLEGDRATFKQATGNRRYLGQSPNDFSATSKFPPAGQKDYSGTADGQTMTLRVANGGPSIALKKVTRKSPSLGMKAPRGATDLFDGSNTNEWNNARLDKKTGLLNTDGHDITTKKRFNNYTVHVEFLLPYRPEARGQGRGNSGFYQVSQYEVQILDSFGLEGENNECGGVYTRIKPKLNMCLPPLQWQTYDIDFTNAVHDPKDPKKVTKHARITIKLNGVAIIDNAEIAGTTGGAWNQPEGTPGPLILQGHGNPLQFRNIWIAEKH